MAPSNVEQDLNRLEAELKRLEAEYNMFFSGRLARPPWETRGRVDALVGCNGGAPLLLRNTTPKTNHWLGLTLRGTSCNRDAIGARLTWSAGGVRRSRLRNGGGSYLSSHDPREVLGLGPATALEWLEITWPLPSGRTERLTNLPIDRYVTIVEGKGLQR